MSSYQYHQERAMQKMELLIGYLTEAGEPMFFHEITKHAARDDIKFSSNMVRRLARRFPFVFRIVERRDHRHKKEYPAVELIGGMVAE